MTFRHIFTESKIGGLTIKNRIVMPGMSTNLASSDGAITDSLIRYYEERAKGGTGLIITEFTTIDFAYGKGAKNQLRIDEDRFVSGFGRLAKAIHIHGAKLFVQLHHAGRESNSALIEGKQIVAPSAVVCKAVGELPRELTTSEVKEIIQKFILGALRCKQAGVDGVELHGAHGYLINQFLSPSTNLRTDQYGGSFENRMRFLKEIVEGIKLYCGTDFPIIVRLSIDEFDDGGITIQLSKRISKYLEMIGVDGLHASAGNYNSFDKIIESPLFEQGWRVYLAEAIKNEVNIPVIAVGNIREPKFVESILAEDKADFVAIGRGHIADPEWSKKVFERREKEIRMCISCLHCVYSSTTVECSINVQAGHELEFTEWETIGKKRHVVIVGGGPGGMEAARVLALRGYQVTLFEKEARLGGQLHLVSDPVYKRKMNWYIDYLVHEMERLRIDKQLQTVASVEKILALDPYAVILATGGQPYVPEIVGNNLPHVHTYEDIKTERKLFQRSRIIVLGSGMVCHSTARRLAEQGNQVTWIEAPKKSGREISPETRLRLIKRLEDNNVEILTEHHLCEILPNCVRIEKKDSGEQTTKEADHVVFAMGVGPYNPLEADLKKCYENVFVIGDAAGHASLADATREGFQVAYNLGNTGSDLSLIGS
ncbi:oxidoreductase [Aquibacillus kalidii]|uniref:oxidoreductase n=1 Tax=Aquibacillus kalidii TaxID=2762597 RepID=UPI00164973E5|nr:FAD-dependent oxidoreductase [Aquibacillus kalidii]